MPHAGVAKSPSGSGDFHDYLARNLSDGYRLAVVTLDDPVGAVAIVHRAITTAWRGVATASEREADVAFERRLDLEVESAIRASGRDAIDSTRDPFEAALADLDGRQQIELARAFGPWESTATADGGSGPTGPSGRADSGDRAATSALGALAARLETGDAVSPGTQNPERGLRALYESRDPGAPAPLQLRMRLQQDYRESEVAAAASSRRSRGWGPSFAINAFLALTTLTLLVALASNVDIRASAAASADPTGDPIAPLTITGVSPVQGGIDGGAVHVGATQQTLIVGFPPSPLWHQSSKDCQADVVGVQPDGSIAQSSAGGNLDLSALTTGTYVSWSIANNGDVNAIDATGATTKLGTLALATFTNPSGLTRVGDTMYQASANSGVAQVGTPGTGDRGSLSAGYLEMSNVDLSTELTNLIIAERGFQANSRVVTTSDEVLQTLVNMKN